MKLGNGFRGFTMRPPSLRARTNTICSRRQQGPFLIFSSPPPPSILLISTYTVRANCVKAWIEGAEGIRFEGFLIFLMDSYRFSLLPPFFGSGNKEEWNNLEIR